MAYCLRIIPVLRASTNYHLLKSPQFSASLHTSPVSCLRKAPVKYSWLGTLWTYFPWPSFLLKAWIRKRYKPEKFGPSEEYRRSMFHKLSIAYAVIAWTGLGVGATLLFQPKTLVESDDSLPYQKDIDKGGALYWINSLKTPDEMQDLGGMKIVKFNGLKYEGVEDITLKVKELGQEKAKRAQQVSLDFYLRKEYSIPQLNDGGPSIEELRESIESEGKDYFLELDFANQKNRVKTRYNPDGTVGEFIGL